MKLHRFVEFIEQIDELSNKDFQTVFNVMHLRSMRRFRKRSPPPKSPRRGELRDCDPNHED